MTVTNIKSNATFASASLPLVGDEFFPASAVGFWIGAGEGAEGSAPWLASLTDRLLGDVYPIAVGEDQAARPLSLNGIGYYLSANADDAPRDSKGYTLTSGRKTAISGLAGTTIIALCNKRASSYSSTQDTLLLNTLAAGSPMHHLRSAAQGNMGLSARRAAAGDAVRTANIAVDLQQWPILIGDIDYANDRVRLRDAISGADSGWVTGIGGTPGAVSGTVVDSHVLGHLGASDRAWSGRLDTLVQTTRLLTDTEVARAVAYLKMRRQRAGYVA